MYLSLPSFFLMFLDEFMIQLQGFCENLDVHIRSISQLYDMLACHYTKYQHINWFVALVDHKVLVAALMAHKNGATKYFASFLLKNGPNLKWDILLVLIETVKVKCIHYELVRCCKWEDCNQDFVLPWVTTSCLIYIKVTYTKINIQRT